jgi:hypothetical protein
MRLAKSGNHCRAGRWDAGRIFWIKARDPLLLEAEFEGKHLELIMGAEGSGENVPVDRF